MSVDLCVQTIDWQTSPP